MSAESIEILKKYFAIPYSGHVFIFTNKITLEDIQQHTFTEILSHNNAPQHHSIPIAILHAIFKFANGLSGKKVLDVGGNTGYFSFLASEAGADVTMVERLERQANVATAMADVRNLKVEIFNCLIQDYLDSSSENFDCAFMFNVFDQMLRTNEAIAWKVLNEISERCKMLFLMMGPTDQIPTAKGLATSTPYSIAPAISHFEKPDYEVILEKTVYKNYKVLATDIYENRQLQVYW